MSDRNTTTSQLAALDLGSNSFHLLIALEDRGRIQVIDKYKEMVRLGEGLTSTNHLDPVVEHRAIQCLERMSERLRSVDSGSVRVVGTNALRRLSKNNQFVALAEQVRLCMDGWHGSIARKLIVIHGASKHFRRHLKKSSN